MASEPRRALPGSEGKKGSPIRVHAQEIEHASRDPQLPRTPNSRVIPSGAPPVTRWRRVVEGPGEIRQRLSRRGAFQAPTAVGNRRSLAGAATRTCALALLYLRAFVRCP